MLAKLDAVGGRSLEITSAMVGPGPVLSPVLAFKFLGGDVVSDSNLADASKGPASMPIDGALSRESVVQLAHSLHVWLANNPAPKK